MKQRLIAILSLLAVCTALLSGPALAAEDPEEGERHSVNFRWSYEDGVWTVDGQSGTYIDDGTSILYTVRVGNEASAHGEVEILVEAGVAHADTSGGDLTEEQEEAVEDMAVASGSLGLLPHDYESIADTLVQEGLELLEDPSTTGDHAVVNVHLDVSVTDVTFDEDAQHHLSSVALDIAAVYTVTVGEETTAPKKLRVDCPVELTVRVPAAMLEGTEELYIHHSKSGYGPYHAHPVTSTDRDAHTVTFTTTDGLSPFVISTENVLPDTEPCRKDESCPIWPYTDATPQAWYHDGVHFCLKNGLMYGTGIREFKPDGITTRAQVITVLHRLENTPEAPTSGFKDVPDGQWYTEAVDWGAANGIIYGVDVDIFRPNDPITRQQFAAILYRYARYKSWDLTYKADLAGYTDAADVSAYAADAMAWANGAGLIVGRAADRLAPAETAIRAETAAILLRLCEKFL